MFGIIAHESFFLISIESSRYTSEQNNLLFEEGISMSTDKTFKGKLEVFQLYKNV